jgi:hypothetical protein
MKKTITILGLIISMLSIFGCSRLDILDNQILGGIINPTITPTCPVCDPGKEILIPQSNLQESSQSAEISPTAPCSPENIEWYLNEIQRLMQDFNSVLLSSDPLLVGDLSSQIEALQNILTEGEVQKVPDCLVDLRAYQLAFMNTQISTYNEIQNGSEQDIVDQGLDLASAYYEQYKQEYISLLNQREFRLKPR